MKQSHDALKRDATILGINERIVRKSHRIITLNLCLFQEENMKNTAKIGPY